MTSFYAVPNQRNFYPLHDQASVLIRAKLRIIIPGHELSEIFVRQSYRLAEQFSAEFWSRIAKADPPNKFDLVDYFQGELL